MQAASLEKHLEEIQRKREELFIQSLNFVGNYYNNSRNYYLIMLLLSVVIVLTDLSLFFSFEFNTFIKISIFFSMIGFFFSLAIYLNFLEKGSEKIGDIFSELDLKYKREITILRNFYAGRINNRDIRDFYLSGQLGIDKKYFGSQYEIVLRWTDFILLSLAMIMLLLNFI